MNRFIELQDALTTHKKRKKKPQPEKTKPALPSAKSFSASYDNIFSRPAFNFSQARSYEGQQYGGMFSKGYYDWPLKFGTTDTYNTEASAWIAANRSAVTHFAGLKAVNIGWSYNGSPSTDPLADWQETDADKLRVYKAIESEMRKTEGGANSINSYDNQIVTFGWGLSMRYADGKRVIEYAMQSSPDFKNAMMEMGLCVENDEIFYVDTNAKKLIKGEPALRMLQRDGKTLSRIITGLDAIKQINVNNQAKIMKQRKFAVIPAAVFKWPSDNAVLAFHLSHWLPAYLDWNKIKGSGGDVATIVKSFILSFHAASSTGFKKDFEFTDLPNGAIYVNDHPPRLDMGNRIFIKSGDKGTIKRIEKSAFTEAHKTDTAFKGTVFVELENKIYILP